MNRAAADTSVFMLEDWIIISPVEVFVTFVFIFAFHVFFLRCVFLKEKFEFIPNFKWTSF